MPRRSASETETAAIAERMGLSRTIERPEPPYDLWRDEETEVWSQVVEALPADWFNGSNLALLAQYCRHVVSARRIAQMLASMEGSSDGLDLKEWRDLMRSQALETERIASLATKMRLSQQSVYGPRSASRAQRNVPTGKRPWER